MTWTKKKWPRARILYIEGYLWDEEQRQAGLAQGDRGGEGRGRTRRAVALRHVSASAVSATSSCICWTAT